LRKTYPNLTLEDVKEFSAVRVQKLLMIIAEKLGLIIK
jgi:hypothetical protein